MCPQGHILLLEKSKIEMTDKINLFDHLPPGFVVDIFRSMELLPLNLSEYDEYIQLDDTLTSMYNLNTETRHDVLYEIRRLGLYEPSTYTFDTVRSVGDYVKFNKSDTTLLFRKELIDFIRENDFGLANPLDPNSDSLISYLCITGGINSACPSASTDVTRTGVIISLLSLYVLHNNLAQGLYISPDDNLKTLLNIVVEEYKEQNPTTRINIKYITYQQFYDLLLLFEVKIFTSPMQIEELKLYSPAYIPEDERTVLYRNIKEIDDYRDSQSEKLASLYHNKWVGIPVEQRTEPPPIRIRTYDMNTLLKNVEAEVGHELSLNTYAVASAIHEQNIVSQAESIHSLMSRYAHLYQ